MEKSAEIGELVVALSRAQGAFPAVPLNAVNPFLHNRYADLGSVIETVKQILSDHELAVTQLVTSREGYVGVTTILAHKSGQWISDTVTLPIGAEKGKSLAQVAGSVITYLRRYALSAILGLYAGDDVDGSEGDKAEAPKNGGAPKDAAQKKAAAPDVRVIDWFDGTQKPADERIDGQNVSYFMKKFVGEGKPLAAKAHLKNHLRAHFHVDELNELTWEKFGALINHVKSDIDDARWYAPEEKAEKPEKEVQGIGDTVNLDALAQKWQKVDFAALEAGLQERVKDMLALVDAQAIAPDDYAAMIEVLDA